ncbi:MAG: hypothetical protein C4346_09145 [Chloroflexota bacterium]
MFAALAVVVFLLVPAPWSGIFGMVCATLGLAVIVSFKKIISGYGCFLLYEAIWGTFHSIRSIADNTDLANHVSSLILRTERALFFGNIPSYTLQLDFYDPYHFHWYDYLLSVIYFSFFFVPLIFGIFTICVSRHLFLRYAVAQAILFALGCIFFFLLPTMPPWMASSASRLPPVHVERIAFNVLAEMQIHLFEHPVGTLANLDANPLAAMPSIHTGVTMLFFLISRQYHRRWQIASLCYVFLMGIALVYLGEHSVLDVLAGMLVAVVAWHTSVAIHREQHGWRRRYVPCLLGRMKPRARAGRPRLTR